MSGTLPTQLSALSNLVLGWFHAKCFTGAMLVEVCDLPNLLFYRRIVWRISGSVVPPVVWMEVSVAYVSVDSATIGYLKKKCYELVQEGAFQG